MKQILYKKKLLMDKKSKRTIYVVSNMYPSEEYPNYGVFVKRFIELISSQFIIVPITIKKQSGVIAKIGSYIKLYLAVLKLLFIKNHNSTLIYVHFPLYVAPALLPFAWLNRKLVLNFHGSDIVFNTWYKKILGFFLKKVVRRSRIVVPSAYYESEVVKVMGPQENSILVYPSGGVNESIFYPIEQNKDMFTLGFVSNFIMGKGWKIFLDSIEELIKGQYIGDFKAIMVGQGKDKDAIIESIEKKNLPVTVRSNVPQEELLNIYAMFDVFVFPSFLKESLGLVGIEAMMCGIPVIASKTGGAMGYVKEAENGYLFDLKDSAALTQKIIIYHQLSEMEKEKMRAHCLQKASEYESKKVTKRLLEFLNEY
ncbi:MAG: glycosyltransferase family 4 protein [Croceitalea sp.]|nr:glycosyltransferase family 4 protein [Croceitalea sp.]